MKPKTLTNTLNTTLVFTLVLPILILGGTIAYITHYSLENEIYKKNQIAISLMKEMVEDRLDVLEDDLMIYRSLLGKGGLESYQVRDYLQTILNHHPDIIAIRILDKDGILKDMMPVDPLSIGDDLSGYPFFYKAIELNGIYWSPSFMNPSLNSPTASLSIPYEGGVINAILDLSRFVVQTTNIDLGTHATIAILDQRGTYVAHTDSNYVKRSRTEKNYNMFRDSFKGEMIEELLIYDGELINCFVDFVGATNWAVVLYQPEKEVVAPLRRVLFITIGFTIFASIIALLFFKLITKGISYSFKQLDLGTKKVSEGEYSFNIKGKNFLEFSKMAERFQTMAQAVEEREKRIVESRKELLLTKFAIDHSSDAVYWTDPDGNFIYVNKAGCESLGYSEDEILNLSITEVDMEFTGWKLDNFWSRVKDERTFSYESKYIRREGDSFPVEVAVNYVEFEGKEFNCSIVRDLTTRKEMELQLQHTQKMEAVGTLAGGIAHDFNNILTAIIGYSELIKFKVDTESSAHKDIQEILKAGMRAKELVQQILLFSRKRDQKSKPLDPIPIVKEALKLLRASIPTTIEIRKDIPESCGKVIADPTKIHQIIMNLTTNSYHAMKDTGGIIGVTLKEVYLGEAEAAYLDVNIIAGKYIKIEVSDNGHGIDRKILKKIFDPYFTTKSQGEGSGLGLSLVMGIVNSFGGAIKVYSEPGEGTTFNIFFPALATAEDSQEVEDEVIEVYGDESILVVDDEKMILDMTKKRLETLGYSVTIEQDSRKASQIFKDNPDKFDLLITDMTMPSMTGMELIEEIFTIKPEFPTILCTGFSELITEDKAYELGVKGFLTKPILAADLSRTIRKVLRKVS